MPPVDVKPIANRARSTIDTVFQPADQGDAISFPHAPRSH